MPNSLTPSWLPGLEPPEEEYLGETSEDRMGGLEQLMAARELPMEEVMMMVMVRGLGTAVGWAKGLKVRLGPRAGLGE